MIENKSQVTADVRSLGEEFGRSFEAGAARATAAVERMANVLNRFGRGTGGGLRFDFGESIARQVSIANRSLAGLERRLERLHTMGSTGTGGNGSARHGTPHPNTAASGAQVAAQTAAAVQNLAARTHAAGGQIGQSLTQGFHPLKSALSTIRSVERGIIRLAFAGYALKRLGAAAVDVIEAPYKATVSADEKRRRFEIGISGMVGSPNAQAIDRGLMRGIGSTSMSLAEQRQLVTAMTHVAPLAQQLSTSSPSGAAGLVNRYSAVAESLSALNPGTSQSEILRSMESAMLGQGRGLRNVVRIDPDQLAALVGRPNGQKAFSGDPDLLVQALQRYTQLFGPQNAGQQLNGLPSVQMQHVRDRFEAAFSDIGESGVLDSVTAKLRSFSEALARYLDPENAEWLAHAKSMGDSLSHVFGDMTDAMAAFVQHLSGADSPAKSIPAFVQQLDTLGQAIAKDSGVIVDAAGAIGGALNYLAGSLKSVATFRDNLRWLVGGHGDPYAPNALPPELKRSMMPPAGEKSVPDSMSTGLDWWTQQVTGYAKSAALAGGELQNLSGDYQGHPEDLMQARAMNALKTVRDAGVLTGDFGDIAGRARQAMTARLGYTALGGDPFQMMAVLNEMGNQDQLFAMAQDNAGKARQSIAIEGYQQALKMRPDDPNRVAALQAARAGTTPLATQAMGYANPMGLPIPPEAYRMMYGSPNLRADLDAESLMALVQAQSRQIQQYGGLLTPSLSPANLLRMSATPMHGTLFSPGRDTLQLQMLRQAYGEAQTSYGSAVAAYGKNPNADTAQAVRDAGASLSELAQAIQKLTVQSNDGVKAVIKLGDRLQQTLEHGLSQGLTAAMTDVHQGWKKSMQEMGKGLIQDFNQSVVDTLMKGIMNGLQQAIKGAGGSVPQGTEGSMGGVFAGIVSLFAKGGGSAAGAANGGVFHGFTPFHAFSQGGIARGPTLGLVGERSDHTPEAVVPMPGGRIPLGSDGRGGVHAILPGGRSIPAVMAYAGGGMASGFDFSRDISSGLASSGGGYSGGSSSSGSGDIYHTTNIQLDGKTIASHTYKLTRNQLRADVMRDARGGGPLRRALAKPV